MATSFTPGPWVVTPKDGGIFHDVNVCREDGLAVAVAVDNGDISPETALANAKLIAAAPDLLAACEAAVAFHTKYPATMPPSMAEDARRFFDVLDAALAKKISL